jgi:hypothetical protein
MMSATLLAEVDKLNRVEKLRLLQHLANALAREEDALSADSLRTDIAYEVWSPYDSAEAAAALLAMLKDEEKTSGG